MKAESFTKELRWSYSTFPLPQTYIISSNKSFYISGYFAKYQVAVDKNPYVVSVAATNKA